MVRPPKVVTLKSVPKLRSSLTPKTMWSNNSLFTRSGCDSKRSVCRRVSLSLSGAKIVKASSVTRAEILHVYKPVVRCVTPTTDLPLAWASVNQLLLRDGDDRNLLPSQAQSTILYFLRKIIKRYIQQQCHVRFGMIQTAAISFFLTIGIHFPSLFLHSLTETGKGIAYQGKNS